MSRSSDRRIRRPSAPASSTPRPTFIPDVRQDYTPGRGPAIDWDATIDFRRHLWSLRPRHRRGDDTTERGPRRPRLAARAGAHPPQPRGGDRIRRHHRRRRRHRPARRRGTHAPAGDRRVPRAGRLLRGPRGATILRASHALHRAAQTEADYLQVYGEGARQGAAAGDLPLARHRLRPDAHELLGSPRPAFRSRGGHPTRRGPCGQDRRHQGASSTRRSSASCAPEFPAQVRIFTATTTTTRR